MTKELLIRKSGQALTLFETQNVIAFVKELNMQTIINNPRATALIFLVFLYGLWRWSRFVLLSVFTVLSLTMLVRYALPPPEAALTVSATLPFIAGCMGISAVLLYFIFIKSD